jgi:hypothetical protein
MKEEINRYIEYLSFFHLDSDKEFWQPNFIACNTKSRLSSTNRVFIPNITHRNNNVELKKYFGEFDFTFWINKENEAGNNIIVDMGSTLRFSYPLMLLNLNQLNFYKQNSLIKVKQLFLHDEILFQWAPLVAKAYEKIDPVEFQKFVSYLLTTQKHKNINFYIGYYDNQACATSVVIKRDNVCDVHWVGTIPSFRNKGVGQAVTLQPLTQLKTNIEKAILYASEMGRSIYEKLGFKEICKINVYTSCNLIY